MLALSPTGRSLRQRRYEGIQSALMVLAILSALIPFVWAFLTSVKLEHQIYAFPPEIIPNPFTLFNYASEFQGGLAQGLFNSTVVSVCAVGLTLMAASLAAYPLARMRFRGSQVILFLIIAPMMIPGLVNLVPIYLILSMLGLLDTYLGLILIYWVGSLPVSVWILRGFFQTVPQELEEAAVVDGCSRVQTLFQIILPVSKPALMAVALLTFISAWNDFIVASIVTTSAEMRTAQIFLYANIGDVEVNWGGLMAAAIVVSLPVVLLFFFLQRGFISGLTAGAVKG
ncbi:MAG TPA: carbohydrate ABC transporter permease [Chloroflexota bacterium]|nr:carbohydrate ABC transporter permease [Chloroflexota bacterium]